MKYKRLICLLICLLLSAQIFPVAYAENSDAVQETTAPAGTESDAPNLSVQGGSHSLDAQSPVLGNNQLIKNATSALLYEIETDTLIYSWNADEKLYPASLVKIMTAMLTIRKGKLSDEVIVTEDVLNTVDANAVSADLQPGEVMTVENLLYCMMVNSANDAAAVLADHISGSQAAFVGEMNRLASQLGCTGTHFENPHGLHNDNQVTTARDMGKILTEAVKDETFRTILGTVNYKIPATNKSEARELETGNLLISSLGNESYYDPRVTGGRTGIAQNGKYCIAATAEKDGLSYISVIMGAASEYEENGNKIKSTGGFHETSALLNQGCDGFRFGQIIYANQAIKQYSVSNGDSDLVVYPDVSISTVLPQNTDVNTLSYRFQENNGALTAPIEKGELIGKVEIWNQGICLGESNLYAMNQVKVRDSSLSQEMNNRSQTPGNLKILWISIGIVGGILLILHLIRGFLRHRKLAKKRRYSHSRRRSR